MFEHQRKLWTQNLVPGKQVYGEELQTIDGNEYRNWTPMKSKLAAAIKNGLTTFPFAPKTHVLYLGSAEGTTLSHLSDILQGTGVLIGIDVSARTVPKLIQISEQRPHLIPILADAEHPAEYPAEIREITFDVLFQDIAQKNQTEIFLANVPLLKTNGYGLLVIKAPSIDSQQPTETVIQEQVQKLEKHVKVLQIVSLEPFEKKHALILCQKN
ncbi:MAG: fibrillarin-like rRNA/tRNA 2'-O-methyltransferase [Candidatus Diapherotrites archaeon]|uniref:Fibrillarin-like rRNA/tRNA 2'-O-methyltransferase n=1 Tax=Candidatus Iainarchaeum sp. TaxID=3101447 RepID=A0A8T4L767_9ARCH|nr:fibrillarin-like rRNA/tRNA 2'-O-methyltransferase [Candidatus Diapherotrites archaeon]